MRRKATWGVFAAALAARVAVVVWAGGRFPPTGDGSYFDALARRIAHGDGYTWLWPDGAVTYAAHYPVGYPAILAAAYALFGASAAVAMLVNALVGAAGAAAMHRLALRAMTPGRALVAGLAVALHPALVPYTAAVMTEGVTAALLIVAAACAAAARVSDQSRRFRAAAGVVLGVATLVRPQCLVLAPVLGALSVGAGGGLRRRAIGAAVVLGLAAVCCLPWTARNCLRMERCALVSVNGGWNLLIGAQTETGTWAEVAVPPDCREVWGEAAKDACFERAAREAIARHPGAWLAMAPAKLAGTFDYIGASPWYMHASNPDAFDERAKLLHGALETVVTRLLLGLALVAVARRRGPRPRARWAVTGVGLAFVVLVHAWVAYLALAVAIALRGSRENLEGPILAPWTAALIVATAATHAVFFGAGRYGLVVLPFVAALAASLWDRIERASTSKRATLL